MVNLTNASRKILSSAALLRCLLSMMYVGQALFHTIHYRQVHVRCPALILFCFSLQGEDHHRMGKAGIAQRTLEFGEPEGQFQDEAMTN